jgi:hypothetical protein
MLQFIIVSQTLFKCHKYCYSLCRTCSFVIFINKIYCVFPKEFSVLLSACRRVSSTPERAIAKFPSSSCTSPPNCSERSSTLPALRRYVSPSDRSSAFVSVPLITTNHHHSQPIKSPSTYLTRHVPHFYFLFQPLHFLYVIFFVLVQ